jgi:hypothetical protein
MMTEGHHNSIQVQNVYNQYGIEDFLFLVLEYTKQDHASLIKTENQWKKKCQHQLLNNPMDCGPTPPVNSRPNNQAIVYDTPTNIKHKKTLTRQIYISGKMIEVPACSDDWQ